MNNLNASGLKLEIEPENIEPVVSIFFDGTLRDELTAGEVTSYWERDKVSMAHDFMDDIKNVLGLDLSDAFNQLFIHDMGEIPFFNMIESLINDAGFYTYNSDTRFEIYLSGDVCPCEEVFA